MNKKLLVTLLHKNLEELAMITASFQELDEYPQAIVQLARRKTEDIQLLLDELAALPTVPAPLEPAAPIVEVQAIAEPVEVPVVEIEEMSLVSLEAEPAPLSEPDASEEQLIVDEPVLSTIEIDELPDLTFATEEAELLPSSEPIADETIQHSPIEPDDLQPVEEEVVVVTEISEPVQPTVVEFEEIEEIAAEHVEVLAETTQDDSENVEVAVEATNETVSESVKVQLEEPRKMTISEKMALQSTSRNDAMAQGQNSISASIANKKITDIKQALSIGDRFRFQRELFKSNGEDMNRTLTYLNLLATENEAMSFLQSKYGWDEASEAANDFYQLVKRKFL